MTRVESEDVDRKLVARFWAAWASRSSQLVSDALRAWLHASEARAVGWWFRAGDRLRLLGFEAVDDMPADVKSGFADAVRDVALSRVELGCVRAAAELRPVVASEDARLRGLSGSASWLERFGAQQSLAIPIVNGGEATGVLAIATVQIIDGESPNWRLLATLASSLAADRS